ncbi:MAG: hypothetical protein HQ517_15690 [SAR324 cluster bacterium]|nr:hypothetical protein [SAR324 cluster bacterium]
MFCDLVGFTSMSEKLDSEETYSIMDRLLEILIQFIRSLINTGVLQKKENRYQILENSPKNLLFTLANSQ